MKVLIIYYSMYGHVQRMAYAVANGASIVEGAEVAMRRVPETLPAEVLEKKGAVEAQETFAQIPMCTLDELAFTDAIIFGTPTRFGNMCGQMRQFLYANDRLWKEAAHHGMIIVGLPYLFEDQMRIYEITGWSPYVASTIAGNSADCIPSENELSAARFQGKYVAMIASNLMGHRREIIDAMMEK